MHLANRDPRDPFLSNPRWTRGEAFTWIVDDWSKLNAELEMFFRQLRWILIGRSKVYLNALDSPIWSQVGEIQYNEY